MWFLKFNILFEVRANKRVLGFRVFESFLGATINELELEERFWGRNVKLSSNHLNIVFWENRPGLVLVEVTTRHKEL